MQKELTSKEQYKKVNVFTHKELQQCDCTFLDFVKLSDYRKQENILQEKINLLIDQLRAVEVNKDAYKKQCEEQEQKHQKQIKEIFNKIEESPNKLGFTIIDNKINWLKFRRMFMPKPKEE